MPKKNKRTNRKKNSSRIDSVTFPLAFNTKEGDDRVTTVASIAETFDRRRPFRVARIWGKLAAYGLHSCLFQWEAYGPISTADNTWVSPMALAVPNGTNFRWNIPVAQCGWYPSDTATTTVLLRLKPVCIDKTKDTGLVGVCNIKILLQPREVDSSCPKLMIPDPAVASCSSSSVCVENEESSDDD